MAKVKNGEGIEGSNEERWDALADKIIADQKVDEARG